jgi:hypothetical protein
MRAPSAATASSMRRRSSPQARRIGAVPMGGS